MAEFKKQKKEINWVYLVLGIMIAVQLGTIIYGFQFKKQGCHSDEIWSYGYANSYYQKDIYCDNEGNLININEWVDSSVLRDYIVVNKGEEFSYGSIYQNQIYDLSPPLHSMILHTICSFFPEHFSLWYSFSINIVAFIVCMLFLFKTARLLKGDTFALCCCALYGFSMGARDTYVYLRMYAMCAALTMVIVYNLVAYLQKVKEKKKLFNCNLWGVCIASFAGFLTHYYMIALVGLLTFFTCVVLLFQKKIRAMFAYGFSMLATLLLSVFVFPSLLNMAQYQSTKIAEQAEQFMNYTFKMRFRIILNFLTRKLFNISVSIISSSNFPVVLGYLVFLVICTSPLVFLLRETRFMKWIFRRVRFILGHAKSIFKYLWRRINWIYIIFFLSIICQIIVVGETSNVYGMGPYEDRYILYIYPLASLVGAAFVYWIGAIILKKKRCCQYVLVGITALLIIFNIYNRTQYKDYYFQERKEGEGIVECVRDRNCIYVTGQAWLLTAAVPYLMDSNEFFQVYRSDYAKHGLEYKEKIDEGQVILLLDTSFLKTVMKYLSATNMLVNDDSDMSDDETEKLYKDILDYFEDLEPSTAMQKLSTESIFGRPIEVYLINP